ncbi:MAG: hypothetical protein FWG74_09955, partial [Planctomycetes bacterium]|nr:hypothetical protein [Planctomycetota bacterium]
MANSGKTFTTPTGSGRIGISIRSRAIGSMPAVLEALNSLKTELRREALADTVNKFAKGGITRPHENGWTNVLARTFFSYSAAGFSPSRLVWEAVIRGLSVIGSADSDNLGALGEMHYAGDVLGVRVTASVETSTFVQSYSDRELNCPGRPGILRAIGAGFTRVPLLSSPDGRFIASLPNRARERNLAMIAKINPVLAPATLDFEQDVVPITPAGNATSAHIFQAYAAKAKTIFPAHHDLAVFWADVLGRSPQDVEGLLDDHNALMDTLTDKLLQLYENGQELASANYPAVTGFFQAVRGAGAVPCILWRDGESAGEANPGKLLDDAVNWGVRAVALTPDHNWNVNNPSMKEKRLAALADLVMAARERDLPLLAGSPMREPGQKFVDSFDAPELAAYFRDFTDSALWLYG